MSFRVSAFVGCVVLGSVLSASCVMGPKLDPSRTVVFVRPITLYQHPLDIHLAWPRDGGSGLPLLVYATGDAGWWRHDSEVFRELASWGYPVAGFSSRNYLKNLVTDTTTPQALARDYRRVIDFARDALALPPGRPVLLVGLSRGAGLAIVAAGQRAVRDVVAGVLAVALTKEEEYVKHYRVRATGSGARRSGRELVDIETYAYLPQLSMPVAVIQSTHDRYRTGRAGAAPVRAGHAFSVPAGHRRSQPQLRRSARPVVCADAAVVNWLRRAAHLAGAGELASGLLVQRPIPALVPFPVTHMPKLSGVTYARFSSTRADRDGGRRRGANPRTQAIHAQRPHPRARPD